nr:unnamed protein product [Spirometra erinaceieuropaei]
MSEWVNVTSGVPQGSVRGPLLFILYVNDSLQELDYGKIMFADDGLFVSMDFLPFSTYNTCDAQSPAGRAFTFDGPLTITLFECVVTSCICAFRLSASGFSLSDCVWRGLRATASEHSLSLKLPVIFSLMVTFNNMCLYYLDLPVYFVARSFSPIFNVFPL